MSDYYDKQSNPITIDEWGKLYENVEYRRVANETIGDVHISTVWLGLNHRFLEGSPLIFETMIFGGRYDQWMRRYSALGQAEYGHSATVDAIRWLEQ